MSTDHNTGYIIDLCCKESIVHSILESQFDIRDNIREINSFIATLEGNPFLPAPGQSTLQNASLLSFFKGQRTFLQQILAQLDRSKDIVLAHTKEIDPTSPSFLNYTHPNNQSIEALVQYPFTLLPLKIASEHSINGEVQRLEVNPSEYLPQDSEYRSEISHNAYPSYYRRYVPEWEVPACSPYRNTSTDWNSFYCTLPTPGTVHPLLPIKTQLFDSSGTPFCKKLELGDCVYNPDTKEFGRVLKWANRNVAVLVIECFTLAPSVATGLVPDLRFEASWRFGTFVIALDSPYTLKRPFAHVSPYTRADSHPFPVHS